MALYVGLMAAGVALCALVVLGWLWWERHLDRARIAHYTHGSTEALRTLTCPACLCRSYSKSAIEAGVCPRCGSTDVRIK